MKILTLERGAKRGKCDSRSRSIFPNCVTPKVARISRGNHQQMTNTTSYWNDPFSVKLPTISRLSEINSLTEYSEVRQIEAMSFIISSRYLWTGRQQDSATDRISKAKLTLTNGNYLEARKLVAQGLEDFPADKQLQRLSTLLAPPQVKPRPTASWKDTAIASTPSSQEKNQTWLQLSGANYQGSWVAVHEGELLGAADSVKELRENLGDLSKALVTKIY